MLKQVLSKLDQRARTTAGIKIKQDTDCTGVLKICPGGRSLAQWQSACLMCKAPGFHPRTGGGRISHDDFILFILHCICQEA